MASTERSLGWATGVAGTDGAVAYDTTRMTAMERNTLGTGRLLTGSFLTMTLTVGNTILSIADGAAIINGYFYESNGAVTIAAAGLANATYTIAVIANTTAGSLTVAANGAGTLTILTSTTRAALVTSAQLATITAAVTSVNILTLGTVVVAGAAFNTLFQAGYNTAISRFASNNQMAQMYLTDGSVSVANSTDVLLFPPYTAFTNASDLSIECDVIAGVITCRNAGNYIIQVRAQWDANTTGARVIRLYNADDNIGWVRPTIANMATALVSGSQDGTYLTSITAPASISIGAWQNSGTTRTISDIWFRIVRA